MKNYDLTPFGFGRGGFVSPLFGDLTRMFDNFDRALEPQAWAPRLDVAETDKAITVQAELPGLTEKDIDVQVHGNLLTVTGQKTLEREQKNTNWHVVERRAGGFSRSLQLPFEPEDKAVDATMKDGVLHISITKPANGGAKKIAVKAGH